MQPNNNTFEEKPKPITHQIAEIEATVYAAKDGLRLIAQQWSNRELASDALDLSLELSRMVEAINRLRVFAECEDSAARTLAVVRR